MVLVNALEAARKRGAPPEADRVTAPVEAVVVVGVAIEEEKEEEEEEDGAIAAVVAARVAVVVGWESVVT